MFNNIGSKIKGLAKFFCFFGIAINVLLGIGCIIAGIIFLDGWGTEEIGIALIIAGPVITIFGSLLSWISSFLLCGFGQLVENSDKLAENARRSAAPVQAPPAPSMQPAPVAARPARPVAPQPSVDVYSSSAQPAPSVCSVCGYTGAFGTFCPKCGTPKK